MAPALAVPGLPAKREPLEKGEAGGALDVGKRLRRHREQAQEFFA